MAGLDDLFAEIPVQDIASKLGADQGEVTNAIQTLVPSLLAGLAQNVQSEDIDSSELESAVAKQGASGLLDGGVSRCKATTRKGKACQRTPLPSRDYCPSHQHLEARASIAA